jgi:NAD-dependent deacetylase
MSIEHEIDKAAHILAGARHAAASCGAGISAESGIATFRDPGGVWEKLNSADVGTTGGLIDTLTNNPARLIPFFLELLDALDKAEPNPAHKALFDLEKMGILKTVITQNIDNLHHEAGNTDVIEVHGNGFRLRCLSCGFLDARDRRALINDTKTKINTMTDFHIESIITMMPTCGQCGGMMRPDVVMFGEAVKDVPRAFASANACDVMLAIGTSGVVYPAAYLPYEAKNSGAGVIVVNPNENAFSEVSDAYIPLKAGEAMPVIVERAKKIKGHIS